MQGRRLNQGIRNRNVACSKAAVVAYRLAGMRAIRHVSCDTRRRHIVGLPRQIPAQRCSPLNRIKGFGCASNFPSLPLCSNYVPKKSQLNTLFMQSPLVVCLESFRIKRAPNYVQLKMSFAAKNREKAWEKWRGNSWLSTDSTHTRHSRIPGGDLLPLQLGLSPRSTSRKLEFRRNCHCHGFPLHSLHRL